LSLVIFVKSDWVERNIEPQAQMQLRKQLQQENTQCLLTKTGS